MFKFRLIILVSIFLIGCESKKSEEKEGTEEKSHHSSSYDDVISQTDSIISFADEKMIRRKEKNMEQRHILDSLENTIRKDRNLITYESIRSRDIEQDLDLTKSQLEEALFRCKEKEMRIAELVKKSEEERNFLMSEIQKIVREKEEISNTYLDVIDSLKMEISSLLDSLVSKEIEEKRKGRGKKRRKS